MRQPCTGQLGRRPLPIEEVVGGVYAKEPAQLSGMDDVDVTGWTGLGALLQEARLTDEQKDGHPREQQGPWGLSMKT